MSFLQKHLSQLALLVALWFASANAIGADLTTAEEGASCDIEEQMTQIAIKLDELALDLQVNSIKKKRAWIMAMQTIQRSFWMAALNGAQKIAASDYDKNNVWHFARMRPWNQARIAVLGPHTNNFCDEICQFVMEKLNTLPQKTPPLLFINAERAVFNYLVAEIGSFKNIYFDELETVNIKLKNDGLIFEHDEHYYLDYLSKLKADEIIYLAPFLLGTIVSADQVLPHHRAVFTSLQQNVDWHRRISVLLLMIAHSRNENPDCMLVFLSKDIIKYLICIGLKAT